MNGISTVSFSEIKDKLNPHLLDRLPDEIRDVEVCVKDARRLLIACNRFDVIAKYVYIAFYEKGIQTDWFRELYREHIKVFSNNSFKEGDGLKHNIDDFYRAFHTLNDSMKNKGFDAGTSIIPISPGDIPIDGAHRLATAAYHNQQITTVRLPITSLEYDYSFFSERKMPVRYMDRVAMEYCKLNPNSHLVHIFPSANGRQQEVEGILNKHFRVFYQKSIYVKNNAPHQICRHLYENEPWLGTVNNGFKGALHKSKLCFNNSFSPLRIFVVDSESLEKTRLAKEEIRALFNIGNHSIHINDTHGESILLAQLFFNGNSIDFLNHHRPHKYKSFQKQFSYFRNWLGEEGLKSDYFCVDGSSPLSVYGLREGRDIDFLHHGYDDKLNTIKNKDVGSHNVHAAAYYSRHKDDIIFNPDLHFYFFGIKFISLDVLRGMKEKRGEQKDFEDIKLIANYSNKGLTYYTILTYSKMNRKYNNTKSTVKRISSKIFNKLNDSRIQFIEKLGSESKVTMFEGFRLHYSKGTSIVLRYKKDGCYEPDVIQTIVDCIKDIKKPVLLDIGANIGMVSLALLKHEKETRIYAFEPGPHQYEYLMKNIKENKLEDIITASSVGVSNKEGEATFAIHHNKHASGDGFIDTNRAGDSTNITVKTITLDKWWKQNKQTDVDFMKIDTEGAELWILEGGREMISALKPTILLEICLENLVNYPYGAGDILDFFDGLGYELFTLDRIRMTRENIDVLPRTVGNYIAYGQ